MKHPEQGDPGGRKLDDIDIRVEFDLLSVSFSAREEPRVLRSLVLGAGVCLETLHIFL